MSRWKRILRRAAFAGLLTGVPACHLPQLRDASAAPATPAEYPPASATTASTDNSSRLSVEEFFNDPLLAGLIRTAAAENRELKALNEEVEVARNEILARRGAFLPSVGFGARVGLEKPSRFTPQGALEEQLQFEPGRPFPDPLPNFLGSLDFFMPLDIWREYRNARDAAVQRYHAAVERRNDFCTRMVSEMAENYYRLLALDQRMQALDEIIKLQQQSMEIAKARKDAGRGTELAVQRFQGDVLKNKSEQRVTQQGIVEAGNKINMLMNSYPKPVDRVTSGFLDLTIRPLQTGVPAQLLQHRPDVRQAERELIAAGLDVKVARARFYPRVDIAAGVGLEALHPRYIFLTPESLVYNVVGNLAVPLINRAAIKADYLSANAKQLQAVYNYQRIVLTAFVEVTNRLAMAENFRTALDFKKEQLKTMEASVETSAKLFQNARVEYVEVLLAQRDLQDARLELIDIKREQLSAIVKAYQALGGGNICDQNALSSKSANE